MGPLSSGATRWFGVSLAFCCHKSVYALQQPLATPAFEGLFIGVRGRGILRSSRTRGPKSHKRATMPPMFARSYPKGRTQRGQHHYLARGKAAMNKKQFIERMVEHTDSPKGEARKHLQAFTTSITEALKAGEEVQLPGFGKFYVREQRAREGKNPQTGERMQIEARKVPAFKAGKTLKESV
jgi:DNA-binding protein HU-beta